jgi:hypothetical protein
MASCHLFITLTCFNTNLNKLPSHREKNATQKSNKRLMDGTIKEETKREGQKKAKKRPKKAQPAGTNKKRKN